jgi:imidazolonepropionase-like amidohydrolase
MPQISRLTLETGGNLPAILVYQLCVKPGFEKMVHDELLTLLHKSRLEVGCLHFDLYRLADSRFYFFDIGYLHLVAGVEATRTIFRGFTTVRDAGGPSFGLKQIIDEGLLVGPRIYPSGASISQTGGHGDRRSKSDVSLHTGGPIPGERIIGTIYLADGPNEVLTAVREQLRRGASQVKLITSGGISSELDSLESVQFTSEEIRAAVQAASDAGTYVMVHNYSSRGARRAIDAGVKCIEHGQLIDEPTKKLIAEKGIWVSMQPFTPAPSIMGNSQLAEASPQ